MLTTFLLMRNTKHHQNIENENLSGNLIFVNNLELIKKLQAVKVIRIQYFVLLGFKIF